MIWFYRFCQSETNSAEFFISTLIIHCPQTCMTTIKLDNILHRNKLFFLNIWNFYYWTASLIAQPHWLWRKLLWEFVWCNHKVTFHQNMWIGVKGNAFRLFFSKSTFLSFSKGKRGRSAFFCCFFYFRIFLFNHPCVLSFHCVRCVLCGVCSVLCANSEKQVCWRRNLCA